MTAKNILLTGLVALAAAQYVGGQTAPPVVDGPPLTAPVSTSLGARPLLDFEESQIKFSMHDLMATLRDSRHEGWVLAAYPDPKTKRPLIGAGFSLDVPEREHLQRDPLNSHSFLEPSSAQLWEAAGLESDRLQKILAKYDKDLNAWTAKRYRKKVKLQTLKPQVSDAEAMQLLRISAIQAVYNAKAYCRGFDDLTGPQQMALSQLVFQMGVNLEEFVQFLGTLNGDAVAPEPAALQPVVQITTGDDHWKTVQTTLIESQWARLYANRAVTVIAMFDPAYDDDPVSAQRRVEATLRPAVVHSRKGRATASVRTASLRKRSPAGSHKATSTLKHKRKVS